MGWIWVYPWVPKYSYKPHTQISKSRSHRRRSPKAHGVTPVATDSSRPRRHL
ncbi:hypothetical protein RchiOBHm_Chr1g0365271 [Rosa chinensis]|uniref:Uncharacterized protein n=1 Tax=Rosa chinensis TaxID=74649 RepID=A0A2P6SK11_ROSCH|nr:hypothetical protein RchiOBHm_Chr1g0365271 [Rosa chinensis]